MNYFSHAVPYLAEPFFLAGTAVPDWLSVADRSVRVRKRLIDRYLLGSEEKETAETKTGPTVEIQCEEFGRQNQMLARGARQHLEDDDWFHRLPDFTEVSTQIAVHFRTSLGPDDGFRAGFLGHIVTEMLLDRVLIQKAPALLDKYYEVLSGIDAERIQQAVNCISTKPTDRLAPLLPRFIESRFLQDYLDLPKMLFRLNQVMQRVKLPMLPEHLVDVLDCSSRIIEARHQDLLPASVLCAVQSGIS